MQQLSRDSYHHIACYLEPKSIFNLKLTCKRLNECLKQDQFWFHKLKFDYPSIHSLDYLTPFQQYKSVYGRQTFEYNWTELLTTDNVSCDFIENIKNQLKKPSFCDEKVLNTERGQQILDEVKTMTFQIDQKRIDNEFKKIADIFADFDLKKIDDNQIEIFREKEEVTVCVTNPSGTYTAYRDCHRDSIDECVNACCQDYGWDSDLVKHNVEYAVRKNSIQFITFFNEKYTIDILAIDDGGDDKYYNLNAEIVSIYNHQLDYYLILGCDGHAFIKSSDFGCSDADGSNLQWCNNLNYILNMSHVFYNDWTTVHDNDD